MLVCIAQTQANVPRSVTSKSGTFTVLNKQKHVPRNFLPFFHDPKQTTHGIWAGFWAESITISYGTQEGCFKRQPADRERPLPRPGPATETTRAPRRSRQKKKKQKEKNKYQNIKYKMFKI